MKRRRDTGRKRIYDAEWSVRVAYDDPPLSKEEVASIVRQVQAERGLYIDVRYTAKGSWAWGGKTRAGYVRINLAPFAMTRQLVCHEVAHCLIPDDAAWHGPEWRSEYLALLARFAPPGMADTTRIMFESVALLRKQHSRTVPLQR
jgi:hypothetical protein